MIKLKQCQWDFVSLFIWNFHSFPWNKTTFNKRFGADFVGLRSIFLIGAKNRKNSHKVQFFGYYFQHFFAAK